MREETLIKEFTQHATVINALVEKNIALEARLRVHEDMATKWCGIPILCLRSIFYPAGIKKEIVERFKNYSVGQMKGKEKGEICK